MEFKFERLMPTSIELTEHRVRQTLLDVQDHLLRKKFTSTDVDKDAPRVFDMDTVCEGTAHDENDNPCGTAACIGGWCTLLMLGVDPTHRDIDPGTADDLMHAMIGLKDDDHDDALNDLFFDYSVTHDYNNPQVAATAIQRYLDGNKEPWPAGEMPDLLPYRE